MPIKIEIYAIPKFKIMLTKNQVAVLMKLSDLHYDGKCQSFGRLGGLIRGWQNCWDADLVINPTPSDELDFYCSHKELDILCKILEINHFMRMLANTELTDYPDALAMSVAFNKSLRLAMDSSKWLPVHTNNGEVCDAY